MTLDALGLHPTHPWWMTAGWAVAWSALMLAYSPTADRLAARWVATPPKLERFRVLRQSRVKLLAGIVVAWVLGGFLEEVLLRGIILRTAESWLTARLGQPAATGAAVCIAAFAGALGHWYQGPRAMIIIAQLSALFGILFVLSGYDLWAVVLCHGMYDTVALVRFAHRKPVARTALPGDGGQ